MVKTRYIELGLSKIKVFSFFLKNIGSDASLHLFPLNSGSDFSLSIIAKAMPLSKCLLFYSQPIGFLNKCIMIIFGGDDDYLENYRKYLPIKRIFSSLKLPCTRQEPVVLTMRSG